MQSRESKKQVQFGRPSQQDREVVTNDEQSHQESIQNQNTLQRKQRQSIYKQSALNFLSTRPSDANQHKLNTFRGVIIPTCENLWGIIIFLRFYWIVGQAGIIQSLLVITVSFVAAFLTVYSLGAIVTSGVSLESNFYLEGGPYYIASRSLGLHIGGTIGIFYFLGLLLLAMLEILGAVEVFHNSSGVNFYGSQRALMFLTMLIVGAMMMYFPKYVKKSGPLFLVIVVVTMIMFIIGLSLAPINDTDGLTGLSIENLENNLYTDYDDGVNFGVMISTFFPCFACIFSGSHKATELKRPGESIMKGTFITIIVSYFLYGFFMVMWAAVGHRNYLKGHFDYFKDHGRRLAAGNDGGKVVKDISLGSPIPIEIGIILASISMGIVCLQVGSKVLRQITQDKLLPNTKWFTKHKNGTPVNSIFFTVVLGTCLGMLGSLDAVANILTVCFLIMFSMINLCCFIYCIFLPPKWRPKGINLIYKRFVYRAFSLIGVLLSLTLMFVIDWKWSLGLLIACIVTYAFISWQGMKESFGSGLQGIKYQIAMSVLHGLRSAKETTINWRPQLLCYHNNQSNQYDTKQLLNCIEMIGKGGGLVIFLGVVNEDVLSANSQAALSYEEQELEYVLYQYDLKVFPKFILSTNETECIKYSMQCSGLGGLVPNTLVLNMPVNADDEQIHTFVDNIKLVSALGKSVIIFKDLQNFYTAEVKNETIDIWWIMHDGGLLLLFGYLISQHRSYNGCKIRVFIVSEQDLQDHEMETKVQLFFYEKIKMNVQTKVVKVQEESLRPFSTDWVVGVKARSEVLTQLDSGSQCSNLSPETFQILYRGKSLISENLKLLNDTIQSESNLSSLVLITLPSADHVDGSDVKEYYDYLQLLSGSLHKVVFLHSEGVEIMEDDHLD